MGKPKKGNRKDDHDDFDSDNEDMGLQNDTEQTETQDIVQPTKKADKKKNKKKGKQKDDDDWGESESVKTTDALKDIDDLEEDTPMASKKNKNKKRGMSAFAMLANIDGDDGGDDDFSDKEMEEEAPVVSKKSKTKTKGVSAFAMLSMDDDNDMGDDDFDDKQSDVEEDSVKEVSVQKSKKKEKPKKKKKEDEDIDAILADIEKPASKSEKKKKKKNKGDAEDEENNVEEAETPEVEVEKMENKVVTIDDLDDEYFEDEKKRKKKNKKKGKEEEITEETKTAEDADGTEGGDDDEFKMKTAAQKKKEKKEREKQRKLEEKQKQAKKDQVKKEKEAKEGPKEEDKSKKESEAAVSHEGTPDVDEGEGGDSQEKEGKKRKKKKVDKEEKKEEKAKPKNKQIAALREALRIQKEEEERAKQELEKFRLEEEERIRKLEEEEQRREEAKKKKRDAKKEREAQLKKEGKWLTAKQRQDKQKLEQMLEAMKLSGVEVGPRPAGEKTSKHGFVHAKKKRPTDNKEKSPSEVTSPTEGSPEVEIKENPEDAKKEVEVTIEDKKIEEDVKDEWDADSDEEQEEEEEEVPQKSRTKPEVKKEEEEEDDDDDESESEDDEDESEDESEEETDESESESDDEKTPIDRGREKVQKRAEKAEKARTLDHLRAPVVCVLGHVDTGKTKILDKLRRTNVQDGEAGGITQQIGATNVPKDAIVDKTKMVKEFAKQDLKIPGLLIIDTPGHESFSNLRIRGSSLCDIAILVVDIMHGLEPQTRESINLLKERKTPFLVALNKVDRLYQWKPQPNNDVQNTVKKQSAHTKAEFDERTQAVIVQLAEEGLNAALFYENKNQREYVSLVPTSAHTGDGMGNLVALVCELCQTMLAKRLMYSPDLQATVMEVKAITGMGTTIDVILINGSLNEGDCIVVAGTEGPIVTQIRGLLMPQPMKELRVKNQYEHHKTVMAAQGVKINAKEMEKALAGLPLFVAHDNDEKEYYKDEVAIVLKDTLESIKVKEQGVFVQASTLGSLEALLEFLRTSKIPYAGINIGPVHKKDIMRASVMLEHDSQYAVILAFDVKVEREAQELADNVGVRIFTADIIYHLFDAFIKFREDCKRQKQEEFKHIAVFPCKLRILPQYIFNSRDPIVMGVSVEAGLVKEGTPICVPTKEFVDIGRIGSLELNHKQVDIARQGQEICIKILPIPGEAPKMFGRHFEDSDMLVSKITRQSIDAVKDYFRDDMTKPDWKLMVELKKEFQIL